MMAAGDGDDKSNGDFFRCIDCRHCWAGAPGIPAHCIRPDLWVEVDPNGGCERYENRNAVDYRSEPVEKLEFPADLLIRLNKQPERLAKPKPKGKHK